jgi:hypothetical protein
MKNKIKVEEHFMMKSKKCGICDYEFTYDDKTYKNPFVQPYGEGAKYYFDLWHFSVEKCPNCGYSSKDIAKSLHKKVVEEEKYKSIAALDIIMELNAARPNRIGAYLEASYYYESVGDILNNVKCLLQAGDLMYAELMYWDEYVLDSSDSITAIISKSQYNELKKFADHLFNTALEKLETYVNEHEDDIDAMILLAGSLSDGNKIQNIKGAKLLHNINAMNLTDGQRKALNFLMEGVN